MLYDFNSLYRDLVLEIIENGADDAGDVRAKYADGTPALTKSLEGISFRVTPSMGVPLLKSKFVGTKWALTEIEWIWQAMSNQVDWLHRNGGVTIWDEWELKDGTIGKAYGWQLRDKVRDICTDMWGTVQSFNQVEYVIYQLRKNPSSRRIMTSLWDVEDLDHMALEPCVWSTHWTVHDGKLNLHVKQRSADVALGLPYNVFQYHALHKLMTEEVGLELGDMHWNIDNAHIYKRHEDGLFSQVTTDLPVEVRESQPELVLPDGCSFFDRRLSQAYVTGYQHMGKHSYEVAI